MPAKTTVYANSLLQLVFNATAYANLFQDGSSPITDLWVSLHTSSPGVTGDQSTNEVSYGSYARVSVARTSGTWIVSGASVSPIVAITFPTQTGGATPTITHFGVGMDASGAGRLLYFGTITPNIPMSTGVTPQLTTASAVTES